MGGLCCCPCSDEFEDYSYPTNAVYRHCFCLRFFVHQLLSGYGSMLHRLEGRSASSAQGGTLASVGGGTGSPDGSENDSQPSFSRPVPYDADQRYARLQRDGLISRKSMTPFQEESQPLRRNRSTSGIGSFISGKNWNAVDPDEDSKLSQSESSNEVSMTKAMHGLAFIQLSSQDEDVCPTCLDGYTPENPKIITRCSHHFHLGCIYEWLERSESCPICGKEMEFCESP